MIFTIFTALSIDYHLSGLVRRYDSRVGFAGVAIIQVNHAYDITVYGASICATTMHTTHDSCTMCLLKCCRTRLSHMICCFIWSQASALVIFFNGWCVLDWFPKICQLYSFGHSVYAIFPLPHNVLVMMSILRDIKTCFQGIVRSSLPAQMMCHSCLVLA